MKSSDCADKIGSYDGMLGFGTFFFSTASTYGPDVDSSSSHRALLHPSVATERSGKGRRSCDTGVIFSTRRNIVNDVVQGSQQLVYLPCGEFSHYGIMKGVQAATASTDELCISMKLWLFILKEIQHFEIDIWPIHTDRQQVSWAV